MSPMIENMLDIAHVASESLLCCPQAQDSPWEVSNFQKYLLNTKVYYIVQRIGRLKLTFSKIVAVKGYGKQEHSP